jgi:hypothetical protein
MTRAIDTAPLRARFEAAVRELVWQRMRAECFALGGPVGAHVGWLVSGFPKGDGSDIIDPPRNREAA